MDPKIEERETNDYLGKNPMEALALGLAAFADRAPHDRVDLAAAIARVAPDVVIVDPNSWGALATAEASGLPWCVFQPYFSPLPSRDAPPFGPGLAPARSRLGRLRDRMLLPLTFGKLDKLALAPVNEMRTAAGLDPAQSMVEVLTRPPLTLYFTAEPLEYHRSDWPDTYEMVGPASWNPPAETPDWLAEVDRPIVLVTCSTESRTTAHFSRLCSTGSPAASSSWWAPAGRMTRRASTSLPMPGSNASSLTTRSSRGRQSWCATGAWASPNVPCSMPSRR